MGDKVIQAYGASPDQYRGNISSENARSGALYIGNMVSMMWHYTSSLSHYKT